MGKTIKVVLLGDYPSQQAAGLKKRLGDGFSIVALGDNASCADRDGALDGAHVVVTNRLDHTIKLGPEVRLLQSPSAGLDGIDVSALPPGVALEAAAGHETAMSEYILAALLDDAISFRKLASAFVDGKWTVNEFIKGPRHGELANRNVGLLGFGAVGRKVAVKLEAFEANIRTYTRSHPRVEGIGRLQSFVGREHLTTFLADLDYLIVCLSLTEETRDFVDTSVIGALPPHAYVINVSRGGTVNERDIFEALKENRIRGACLDVWYNYPSEDPNVPVYPSSFPFHKLSNVVMTPHCSGRTNGTFERRWDAIAENIKNVRVI